MRLKMPFYSGLPETACGIGSTLEKTKGLRADLPKLFAKYGITSVLDAPCGDFNWMAHVELSSIDYTGGDFDPEHLVVARRRAPERRFIELDITSDPLPRADLMLCRECLQHLSNGDIRKVLDNFYRSGIEWLLVTNHCVSENTELERGFRKVDLTLAPYSLPLPQSAIADGSGHLGLWHRDD